MEHERPKYELFIRPTASHSFLFARHYMPTGDKALHRFL